MGTEIVYSLKELYHSLQLEKNSPEIRTRRFPIRFIFTNSFQELRDVVKFLTKEWSIQSSEISKLLPKENAWLTSEEIVNWIKGISRDTVIVPLSEFLRFQGKDEFRSILKSLTEIEKHDDIRIYIPLVGLWERFEQEFWNRFYRKEEWAPIWKLETPSKKLTVYQIDFELEHKSVSLKDYAIVFTTKEWLNIWKRENLKGILSFSKSLSYLYEDFFPDRTFEVKKISNPKKFLEEIFKVAVPAEYHEDEIDYWNNLLLEVGKYNFIGLSIEKIFLKHFNFGTLQKLPLQKFLSLFLEKDQDYERWLVRTIFLSLDKFKHSYLYKCFEDLDDLNRETLIRNLWLSIFDLPLEIVTPEILTERRVHLNFVHKTLKLSYSFIENDLMHKLRTIDDFPIIKKFNYLTNITFSERKYIITELKKATNIKTIYPILKEIYPELAFYIDWNAVKPDNKVDSWIIEYFNEYNHSKLKHTKSSKINELINEKNKDKLTFSDWYYSLPNPKIEEGTKHIWVDGLGAEWFPLLIHFINEYGKEKGKIITKKMIVRVNLPSITECNKYEFEKIDDLDTYVHSQGTYKYPDNLIEEIEIVRNIVKKILELPYDKICVMSDHGFTFLCLPDFGNFKRLDLSDAEHEGRCMWIDTTNHVNDEYFVIWNTDEGNCRDKKSLLALKHVSLNNTPRREVHGGATPEEILVPYIIIETEKGKIEYRIEIINSEIWIDNPILQIKIDPLPPYIPEAFANDKNLPVSFQEENGFYNIDLKSLKTDTHLITVIIGSTHQTLKVTIKGGFKERDLFDE